MLGYEGIRFIMIVVKIVDIQFNIWYSDMFENTFGFCSVKLGERKMDK